MKIAFGVHCATLAQPRRLTYAELMPRVTTSARRRLDGPWTDNRGLRPFTPTRLMVLIVLFVGGLLLAAWLTGDLHL